MEGGLPGSTGPKHDPACYPPLRPGIYEARDRIPRKKPDRGEEAPAGSLEPVALDLKALGERIAARPSDSQTAEIQIRVAFINRCNAFATTETVRVA